MTRRSARDADIFNGPHPGKYAVFRVNEDGTLGQQIPHTNHFVIKSTDVFGPQALWGYVQLIQSCMELHSVRPFLSAGELEHLQVITENIAAIAQRWQGQAHKIPD
jgi:hypothetical protein